MSNFEEFLLDRGLKLKSGYIFFRDRFEYQGKIFRFKDVVSVEVPYHGYENKVPKNNLSHTGSLPYKIYVSPGNVISCHVFNFSPHSLCIKLLLSESVEKRREKFIKQIDDFGFFDYDSYRIYADGKIIHDGKVYSLNDIEFKNGVYILERMGAFSPDLALEINDNYDVVLELLKYFRNSHSKGGKENAFNSHGGSEMALWKLVRGAASSMLDLYVIQKGADKVLLDAGFNILSINKKIHKAADDEVRNYFIKEVDGTSISYYEAAMLKICLLYQLAKEVGDMRLENIIECTEEKLQIIGSGKIRTIFYVKFHCL
jgi:hypothetical protein